MSLVNIDPQIFSNLKGKVVVVLGATTGIGASIVSQLTDAGAEVTWGDIVPPSTPDPRFVQTDASSYASILNLFKVARNRQHNSSSGSNKPIDHAVCNAGVGDAQRFFTTDSSDAAIEAEPATGTIDVNLRGPLFFLRIAAHFLRKREGEEEEEEEEEEGDGVGERERSPSIVLVSSNAGFIEFPGTYQYSATKHGVVGLFRSSKSFLLGAEGVRVNVVLPGLTRTPMTTTIVEPLQALGVACNEAEDVARTIVHALATRDANGEAYYVSDGKAYEIEKGLQATRPQWLGEQLDRETTIMQNAFAEQAIRDHKLRKAGELKD